MGLALSVLPLPRQRTLADRANVASLRAVEPDEVVGDIRRL